MKEVSIRQGFLLVNLYISLFLVIIIETGASAQEISKSDSLLQILKMSKLDSNRVNALYALSGEILYENTNDALKYGSEALKLGRKFSTESKIAKILNNLGIACVITTDFPKSKTYFEEALIIAKKNKDFLFVGELYGNMGTLYSQQAKLDSSILYLKKSLPYFKAAKAELGKARTLYNISGNYLTMGKPAEGFDFALKALRLVEKFNDEHLLSRIHDNLGMLFLLQGEHDKAEEHLIKALNIAEKLNSQYSVSYTLQNLGSLYSSKKNLEKALKYYKRAVKISEEINFLNTLSSSLTSIGEIYLEKGEYAESANYLMKCLEVSTKNDHLHGIADASLCLGTLYGRTGKYDLGLLHIDKGIEAFQEMGIKEGIREGYERKTALYKKMGNYHLALSSFEKYKQWHDSIFNESNANKIHELEIQYQTEKKDNQIKALSQQAKIQELQSERQQLYLFGSISLAIVLFFIGSLLYRQKVLKARQQNIELEQKLLLSQLNPHFIFNALTAIQHYLFIHPAAEVGKYLSRFAKLMRLILENSREKYITLETEISTLTYYLELQNLRFQNKFDYQIYVDPNLDPSTVLIPPMFAQPLIENCLEHGIANKDEKGKITVRFSCKENMILLEVEDNGIGLQKAQQIKASTASSHKSMASVITQERLATINRRQKQKVKLNISELLDEQNNVQGTKATFAIPYQEVV